MADPLDPSISTSNARPNRLPRVIGLSVLAGLLICLLMVFEQFMRFTGFWPPTRYDTTGLVVIVLAIELARRAINWLWIEPIVREKLRRYVEWSDKTAVWALDAHRPSRFVSILIVILLICWAPHYLAWPFWTDHDVLATLAIGWDQGRLPWRDQLSFQFPGEIELFWLLGRTFGWGSSLAFYLADLTLLGLLLATVTYSCRACLGRWLPGLMASLAILSFYVTLSFTRVAQRDWHSAEFAAISLMLLIAGTSWRLRLASSLAYAIALTFRPHAIVFLPVLGCALLFPPQGGIGRRSSILTWLGGVAGGLLIGFSPVFLNGLTRDFVRAMHFVSESGGPYAKSSVSKFSRILKTQLDGWSLMLGALVLFLAWLTQCQRSRRFAAIVYLGMVCALVYRPLHPVDHGYLTQPLILFQSITFAAIVDGILSFRLPAPAQVAALILLVDVALPWRSENCNPLDSARAVWSMVTRKDLATSPPGSANGYVLKRHPAYPYDWKDYLSTLRYLRENTTPSTPVANLLTYFPYPSINAAVGRPTPLPIETISLISWFPDIDFDASIAPVLDQGDNIVVVCDVSRQEDKFAERLKRTRAVLDKEFLSVARFGNLDIRKRQHRRESDSSKSLEGSQNPTARLIEEGINGDKTKSKAEDDKFDPSNEIR